MQSGSTESSVHVTPTRAGEAWDSALAQAAQPDTAHVQHQHSHIWQAAASDSDTQITRDYIGFSLDQL